MIVPATADGLHPSTLPAILRSGWECEVRPMVAVDSYWLLFKHLWDYPDTVAIVEHDIEVGPDTLNDLARCPEPWCGCSYEVYAGDVATAYGGVYSLGCSRFRVELIEATRDAVYAAGEMNIHPVHPQRSYAVMDSTLTQQLRSRGFEPHQHFPNVTHHHRYMREGAYLP